jgi:hypothetical protein
VRELVLTRTSITSQCLARHLHLAIALRSVYVFSLNNESIA